MSKQGGEGGKLLNRGGVGAVMMMMMMMMMIFTLKHWEGILDFGIFNKIHPFSIPLLDLWNFGIRHVMGSPHQGGQVQELTLGPMSFFCCLTIKVIRVYESLNH